MVIIMYICNMKKNRILQHSFSLCSDETNNRYFILIEHYNDKIVNISFVMIPAVLNFWDEKFCYYPFLWN
jgi:hypothetical protein